MKGFSVSISGHCPASAEVLLQTLHAQGPRALLDLPGEWVLAFEGVGETLIVTSLYGTAPYFYTVAHGRLHHGENVLQVLQKARLDWRWHWRALADFLELGHLIEDDTLHPAVWRTPARSVLHFQNGHLEITRYPWEDFHTRRSCPPRESVAIFNEATRKLAEDSDNIVSISAGFDSRVMLASLLKLGHKPRLLGMGFPHSTDTVISQRIAAACRLPLAMVALQPEGYRAHAGEIVTRTSGSNPATDWHAYIYIQQSPYGEGAPMFIGTNGEFARSYYVDHGGYATAGLVVDKAGPTALGYFWRKKLKQLFTHREIDALHPALRDYLVGNGKSERVARLVRLSGNRLMEGLDRFYLDQRVRQGVSVGIRYANSRYSGRSPFLDRAWVEAIWNLPRPWKIGANWHRYAISQNWPQLLRIPEEGRSGPMRSRAPLLYPWMWPEKQPVIPYADYENWFRQEGLLNHLWESRHGLAEVMEESLVATIIQAQREGESRTRAFAALLTLACWQERVCQIVPHGGALTVGSP